MGTDIHFFVERRTADGWERAEREEPNPHADAAAYAEDPSDDWYAPTRREDWYDTRSYVCFSVLADVRNGSGFAGTDTGDRLPVIHEQRGLPEDVTESAARECEDLHSVSWATVAELLAFDWSQTMVRRGWVNVEQFDFFKRYGKPNGWCGGVSGGSVQHITNQEMERHREEWLKLPWDARREKRTTSFYTAIEWTQPIHEGCTDFMVTLVRMAHLALPDMTSVRAVYGFDS